MTMVDCRITNCVPFSKCYTQKVASFPNSYKCIHICGSDINEPIYNVCKLKNHRGLYALYSVSQ